MVVQLGSHWTVFYDKNWKSTTPIYNFSTVEEFWRFFNHSPPPQSMRHQTNYSVFRQGIRPEWEDPGNVNGGKWVMNFRNRHDRLNDTFLELLLHIVGNEWDTRCPRKICGIVINIRNGGCRLSIWTSSLPDDKEVLEIGKKIRAHVALLLHVPADEKVLEFKSHKEAITQSSAFESSTLAHL